MFSPQKRTLLYWKGKTEISGRGLALGSDERFTWTPEAARQPTSVWAAASWRPERRYSLWPAGKAATRFHGWDQTWKLPADIPETSPYRRLLYHLSVTWQRIRIFHSKLWCSHWMLYFFFFQIAFWHQCQNSRYYIGKHKLCFSATKLQDKSSETYTNHTWMSQLVPIVEMMLGVTRHGLSFDVGCQTEFYKIKKERWQIKTTEKHSALCTIWSQSYPAVCCSSPLCQQDF